MPVVPICWVLVRDPEHRFQPRALLCTDLARTPERSMRLAGEPEADRTAMLAAGPIDAFLDLVPPAAGTWWRARR